MNQGTVKSCIAVFKKGGLKLIFPIQSKFPLPFIKFKSNKGILKCSDLELAFSGNGKGKDELTICDIHTDGRVPVR